MHFLLKKWEVNGNIEYKKSIKARVMRAGCYFRISHPDNNTALFCVVGNGRVLCYAFKRSVYHFICGKGYWDLWKRKWKKQLKK